MSETRRKPTTGRQPPSLFDKWHGIFYIMPSRIDEAGHTKAFDFPVAEHWGRAEMFSSAGGTRNDNTSVQSRTRYQLSHPGSPKGGGRVSPPRVSPSKPHWHPCPRSVMDKMRYSLFSWCLILAGLTLYSVTIINPERVAYYYIIWSLSNGWEIQREERVAEWLQSAPNDLWLWSLDLPSGWRGQN